MLCEYNSWLRLVPRMFVFTGTTLIACAGLSAGSGGGADQRGCYRAGGGGGKWLNEEREWGIGVHSNYAFRFMSASVMILGRNGHFGKRFVRKVAFILYI